MGIVEKTIKGVQQDVRVCDRCGGKFFCQMRDTTGGQPEEFDVCKTCRSKLLRLKGFVDAYKVEE